MDALFAEPIDRSTAPSRRSPVAKVAAVRHGPDGPGAPTAETVAAEVPVALFYNCTSHVVMMTTPADLEDFAIGFSLAEGIIGAASEIDHVESAELDRGMKLSLRIPSHRAELLSGRKRNMAGRTGCGLCGVTTIDEALRPLPRLVPAPPIAASAVTRAMRALPQWQSVNRQTGAVHAAGFADRSGALIAVREDVGRHCALDKLIGAVARSGRRPADGFVLVTSRCSMEMVQKAATAGFPLIASVSAPTGLAVDLAQDCGVTLAAFVRGDTFTVYARPEGVLAGP